MKLAWIPALAVALSFAAPLAAAEPDYPSSRGGKATGQVQLKKTQLDDKFRSEGIAVADFNGDGRLDIAAGSVWYEAPDWKMHAIVESPKTYDPKNYSNSFNNWAEDLSGDGLADLVVVEWPGKPAWWFENPGKTAGPWKQRVLTPVASNESPQFVDIDGDGKRELVCGVSPDADNVDGPRRQMAIVSRRNKADQPWQPRAISRREAPGTTRYSHGLGVGDINGDGRRDVVVPQGWWRAPAKGDAADQWTFHEAPLGQACADMRVFDFDGDGDNDVVSSSAHAFGIWWHENLGNEKWKTHEIDRTFSQTHSLWLADINGDGLPDLVTGKRWWAHAAGDPGVDEPAVLYWFELSRQDGKPRWKPHLIDRDSGVGTQFEVIDVDGDGLLDIVTANKKGVHLFTQSRP